MEENKQTTVLLPAGLWEWLRTEAFNRKISQSQLIRELLEAERDRSGAS